MGCGGFSIYNWNPQGYMHMTKIKDQRKGLRVGAWAALAAGCAALVFLPGCKQQEQPPGQHSSADLKKEATDAGKDLKTSVQEVQAAISGDDSAIAHDMVNLNYASEDKLASLPGITKAKAKMIMNNRPYNTPLDLVYKKVITQEEYDKLVNRVVTWDNLWTKSD